MDFYFALFAQQKRSLLPLEISLTGGERERVAHLNFQAKFSLGAFEMGEIEESSSPFPKNFPSQFPSSPLSILGGTMEGGRKVGTRESRTRGRVKRTPRLAPVNGLLSMCRRGRRRGLLTKKGGRAGRRRLRNWGQRRKKEKGADFLYTTEFVRGSACSTLSPSLPIPLSITSTPFLFRGRAWEAEGKKTQISSPPSFRVPLPSSSPFSLE